MIRDIPLDFACFMCLGCHGTTSVFFKGLAACELLACSVSRRTGEVLEEPSGVDCDLKSGIVTGNYPKNSFFLRTENDIFRERHEERSEMP